MSNCTQLSVRKNINTDTILHQSVNIRSEAELLPGITHTLNVKRVRVCGASNLFLTCFIVTELDTQEPEI